MRIVNQRVVDKRFIFGDVEREKFVSIMRLYEAFCGVRVLSCCVMINHFHLLVEVPPNMDDSLSDAALINRLSLLYKEDYVSVIADQLEKLSASDTEKGDEAYQALRKQFTSSMWDLGLFMKTLKQRFTTWYNKRNGRRGTLSDLGAIWDDVTRVQAGGVYESNLKNLYKGSGS